ncbi:SlyX family protein [Chitinophaga sp. sic0106]|uniref:SlyX family protein n=1 Tax=Chitinophaga sp. sic0106 TaxID=2854785 RepID=UPI001C454289|nr:SlyX family protein [Chitinophaga sp. sic0106]MBV7532983.1 SlyX family protein [Chitinophaga sp. sic0106]
MKKVILVLLGIVAINAGASAQAPVLLNPNGGNVGINTDNPQSALQIGNKYPDNTSKISFPGPYNFEVMRLGAESNGNGMIEFVNHASLTTSYGIKMGASVDKFGGGFYIIAAPQAESYEALTYASSPAFFVTHMNDVGIGTAYTAGYKLAVAGNMIAERIKVKTAGNWPDYVFTPSYNLPSLKEVESYINTHQHLPGIPSAAEVAEEGLDVSDTQAQLLRKIEELTLYVIEQQKRIEKQEQLLAEQQERLKKLER